MKTRVTLFFIFIFLSLTTFAQQIDTAMLRSEMEKLSWMEGTWKGKASMQRGPGEPLIINQTEKVEFKLDGLMLFIEGIGKYTEAGSNAEKVGHHAIAVLTYDPQKKHYRFQSYLNSGLQGDTYLKIVGENQYEWGFEGRVKYLITHNPSEQTWNETGEYSADNGNTWNKFIEMNLKKIN